MYDVLNHIAVDSILGQARDYEVDLAIHHLTHTRDNDLLLCDRNYASYRWLAALFSENRHFVVRCSASSFTPARNMLKGQGDASQIVTLKPKGLPEITVRFVRVLLDTGEYEVLVTNLLNEKEYPVEDFKFIYHLRWGVETFYGILKTRLNLENFTGRTVESVYQDFYSSVYLTGLEAILTADTNVALSEKPTLYHQQVNRSVSFNAIKHHAIEILFNEKDSDLILKKLEALFLTNPTFHRENRNVTRKRPSARHLLNYVKRYRKLTY